MAKLGAHVLGAGEPLFVMKVAEVSFTLFLFVQITDGDVQAHGSITHGSGVETSGLHFQARVETDRPFDYVPLATRFGPGYGFLRSGENPLLIGVPRLGFRSRL